IGAARPRRKFERLIGEERQVVFDRADAIFRSGVELRPEEIAYARLHIEQVIDRNLLSRLFVRVIGQVFADRVIEREPALLAQLEHCDLGEEFVDPPEVEFRVDAVGDVVRLAGQTHGALKDRLVVFGDHHDAGENVVRAALINHRVQALNQAGLAELFLAGLGRGAARPTLGARRRGRANSNALDFVRRMRPDLYGEAHPPLSLLHLSEDLDLELTRPRYAVNPQPA